MNLKWLKEGKHTLWLAVALMAVVAAMLLFGGEKTTGGASQEERRIAQVLSAMAGAGNVEVALFYAPDAYTASAQQVSGAVVVAQGAADMSVRLSLIRAVRTLLNLPENAVDVFVMEDSR